MAKFYITTLHSKASRYIAAGWRYGEEQVGNFIPSCGEYQVVLEYDGDEPPKAPEVER